MAKKTKKNDDFKKYSLSGEEALEARRIVATKGFLRTALEGVEYSWQVFKARVEARNGIGKAPEGYMLQTMIDVETNELHLRKVKIEAPPAGKKGEEPAKPEESTEKPKEGGEKV